MLKNATKSKAHPFIMPGIGLASLLVAITGFAEVPHAGCEKTGISNNQNECRSMEVLRLAKQMEETYAAAIRSVPDVPFLEHQQQLWIQEMDKCGDETCLTRQYSSRIDELNRVLSLDSSADTQESHKFKSESDKLVFMRDLMRWMSREWKIDGYEKKPRLCKKLINDLIDGRSYRVVEPMFTASSAKDDRLTKYNKCADKPFTQGHVKGEFIYLQMLGDAPYRYYELELDGDSNNGLEEVVYTEWRGSEGSTGYNWVSEDDDACYVSGGASSGIDDWMGRARTYYRLNTLIEYDKEYYAVFIEPMSYGGAGNYRLSISNLRHPPVNLLMCVRLQDYSE